MTTTNPLDIPEILTRVGSFIELWDHRRNGEYNFNPQDMLSCLLVSHHFRNTLLSIFWRTYDEMAMTKVPANLVSEYSPFFRAYFNYGYRRDFPNNQRELSTSLIHLTFYDMRGNLLSTQSIEFIKSNSRLKYLGICWIKSGPSYEEMFDKLEQLEHLQYFVQGPYSVGLHQRLFQPISATLKVLHFGSIKGPVGFQGLVFPNLKELYTNMDDPQDARDLLKACPNLERLGEFYPSRLVPNVTTTVLSTNLCLKDLQMTAPYSSETTPEEAIEKCIGLERLDIQLKNHVTERLARAIGHHTSLTHLSINVPQVKPSTIFQVLDSCGQLKHVSLRDIEAVDVKSFLDKDHWMNPESLESLKLGSYNWAIFDAKSTWSQMTSPDFPQHGRRITWAKQAEQHSGRKMSSSPPWGSQRSDHMDEFLNVLLGADMEAFVRLDQIELNGCVYRRLPVAE
ncbi:hypothetical protein B0O80DRAFT_499765 [Mortierella sp. GBAus27b]|nr:hypothetical protein BGX31_002426 [Mortierella sp. GBA43]KAI8351846.1 hypothetical protein B0O80DRAFT_499765 [Mortierella sp. GBAus27b]